MSSHGLVLIVNLTQPRTAWKRNLSEDCLDQVGRWACLWGGEIILIAFFDVGRFSSKVGGTISQFGTLDGRGGEKVG